MAGKVWVTGMGVATSMGMNVDQSLASFRAKRTGIGPIEILDTIHRPDFKVGEIRLTNAKMMEMLGLPADQTRDYTRTTLIGAIAAREAYHSAAITGEDGITTALVSATTVGGMDRTEVDYAAGNLNSGFIQTHPCGDSTEKIADLLGLTGYRTTLSTACSSGANAIIHGAQLIRHGIVDRAIVGGVDPLSKFTLNGFNSLMILDRKPCQPFDQHRRGLNLGEGAGFLVLESDSLAARKEGRKICRLSGYANANDAYHQTASSPEGLGPYLAMRNALVVGNLLPNDIDYINAHGTGTDNNDLTEGIAIEKIFKPNIPPVSSTKPFTGHTLGAAGAIEAIFSIF